MYYNKFKRTKYACYSSYIAMSCVFSLPPMLFVTFREMYGVSYTLLGTLVLINFCTQLAIDLIFTFFSKFFNITKTVRTMPFITTLGLFIYAVIPSVFPQYAYLGLVMGTIVFSVSAGLCEVLLSPLVAPISSESPDRDMSRLHSLYAYGVVTVVVLSTILLKIFGTENWMFITGFWGIIQLIPLVMFNISPIPDMDISHNETKGSQKKKYGILSLCVLCIFLGSAAENTMTNWISGFMENALDIPKTVGDIFGLALFAILLGFTRTAYAKYGKNIISVLMWSMAGAVACYITVGITSNIFVSMVACVLTGVFTSMLWPGTLIMMEERLPGVGVAAYALMAAGGDLGGSVAPQMLGIVVDKVSESTLAKEFSEMFSLTAEQIGMRAGMLTAAIFPIFGFVLLIVIRRVFAKEQSRKN